MRRIVLVSAIILSLAAVPAAAAVSGVLTGTEGNDRDLFELDGPSTVQLLAGDDVQHGSDGPDLLDGGAGNDQLSGGAGSDHLIGGPGNNGLLGDRDRRGNMDPRFGGDDWLEGGNGRDYAEGGAGDDRIDLGAGADVVKGGAGFNVISTGPGNDHILLGDYRGLLPLRSVAGRVDAGAGRDHIEARGSNMTLLGGDGDDYIAGDGTTVALDAGAGNDVVTFTERSRMTTSLGAGTDYFTSGGYWGDRPSRVRDAVNCGPGVDFAVVSSGDTYRECEGVLVVPTMRFTGIRAHAGSAGNDTLVGTGAGESFFPGSGTDHVTAGGGDDLVVLYSSRWAESWQYGVDGSPDVVDCGPGRDVVISEYYRDATNDRLKNCEVVLDNASLSAPIGT